MFYIIEKLGVVVNKNWNNQKVYGFRLKIQGENFKTSFLYYKGLRLENKATFKEIAKAILQDFKDYKDFENNFSDFCLEFGYEESDSKAKNIFKLLKSNYNKLLTIKQSKEKLFSK